VCGLGIKERNFYEKNKRNDMVDKNKEAIKILEENSLKDEVYDRICEKVILKYDIKDMDESELVKEEEGDE